MLDSNPTGQKKKTLSNVYSSLKEPFKDWSLKVFVSVLLVGFPMP